MTNEEDQVEGPFYITVEKIVEHEDGGSDGTQRLSCRGYEQDLQSDVGGLRHALRRRILRQ